MTPENRSSADQASSRLWGVVTVCYADFERRPTDIDAFLSYRWAMRAFYDQFVETCRG